MKKLLTLFVVLAGLQTSFAQRMRVLEHYALSYGFDKKTNVPSFMYAQSLVMGKNHNFAVGAGVRITSFFNVGQPYNGFETKNKGVNIIPYPRANSTTFNIPVMFELHAQKVMIGASFDIIGLGFGRKRDSVTVISSSSQRIDSVSATPTRVNLAFGGRGTTNNEIYIGFKPQSELTIRAGVCFMYSQYNASYRKNGKDVDFGRFRYDVPWMPFVSIVFNFER
ncbi:hypothetical protein [Emticicia sp. 17c]|uniref:hypothetical protein n=1 Tax=Emticicia sp. 17c TaxID=3127704 RepID=UPI00301C3F41